MPVATVLCGLMGVSCAQPPAAQSSAATDPVAAARDRLLRTVVLSCQQRSDCATLGIGARACGGPEQYLAYAVRDTPAAALQQAATKYTRLRKQQIEDRGEMSTCELLPDPGAQCSAVGQCELQPASRRGLPGQLAR